MGTGFFNIIICFYINIRDLFFLLFITPIPLLNSLSWAVLEDAVNRIQETLNERLANEGLNGEGNFGAGRAASDEDRQRTVLTQLVGPG